MLYLLYRAVKVANNVPGAQIGKNLLKDLQNGESVQTILLNKYLDLINKQFHSKPAFKFFDFEKNNSGKEAINFLPADGPAKDLAMKGLGAAQAMKGGESISNVVNDQ